MHIKQEAILMFRIDDAKRRVIETICFQMGMTAVEVAAEEENAPLGLLAGAEGWRNPLLMGNIREVQPLTEAAAVPCGSISEGGADAAECGVERRAAAGRIEAGTGGIF